MKNEIKVKELRLDRRRKWQEIIKKKMNGKRIDMN